MSVKVSHLVWQSDIGPANKRLVLLALADNANDAGFCKPGLAYLHGKTGVGRSTIIRIMKDLETEKIVQRRVRRRANGSRRSNAYRLNLELLVSRTRIVTAAEEDDLAALFNEDPQVSDGDEQADDEDPQVDDMVPERDFDNVPERDHAEPSGTPRSDAPPRRSDAWSRSGTGVVPERDPLNRQLDRHSDRSTSSSAPPPREEPPPKPAEPLREDAEALCSRLRDWMIANECKPPTITEGWRKAARLLLDKDGRDLEKALNLIDWVGKDDFWRAQILSMRTFRAKYDQLRLKAIAQHEQERRVTAGPQRRSLTTEAVESADEAVDEWERRQAARQRSELIGAARGITA